MRRYLSVMLLLASTTFAINAVISAGSAHAQPLSPGVTYFDYRGQILNTAGLPAVYTEMTGSFMWDGTNTTYISGPTCTVTPANSDYSYEFVETPHTGHYATGPNGTEIMYWCNFDIIAHGIIGDTRTHNGARVHGFPGSGWLGFTVGPAPN